MCKPRVRPRLRNLLASAFGIFLVIAIMTGATNAEEVSGARIGRIRAALIYYLVKFVDWPSLDDANINRNLELCLLGSDPLNHFLENTVRGKKIHNHNLVIREQREDKIAQSCNLVFFSEEKVSLLREKQLVLGEESPLTVCAVQKPDWGYCMIQLYEKENRIRIAIDVDLAKRANYSISSELLEVADLKGEM